MEDKRRSDRCIHGAPFPCAQCKANRRWNEAATRKKLTEAEFEAIYRVGEQPPSQREGAEQ
jgi:hypothetical protein